MILGPPAMVEQVQNDLKEEFTCKQEEEITEYVGSKLTLIRGSSGLGMAKLTKPVLVQKLEEEYMLTIGMASKTRQLSQDRFW
jgi:hypothetical protein